MKLVKWKVSEGSRLLDTGSKHSESERLVLDELLNRELGSFEPKPDRSYTLQAGDLLTSAYGDEFQRVREAHVMDEKEMDVSGGHLFAPPVGTLDAIPGAKEYLSAKEAERLLDGKPSCAHPSMNRDVFDKNGNKHAACDDCDFVDPNPCDYVARQGWGDPASTPLEDIQNAKREIERMGIFREPYKGPPLQDPGCDSDRAREDRELARAIEKAAADGDLDPTSARELLKGLVQGVARKVVRKLAEEALNKAIGSMPLGGGTIIGRVKAPCAPDDHRVVAHRSEELQGTLYRCVVCNARLVVGDAEMLNRRTPPDEAEVRRSLR